MNLLDKKIWLIEYRKGLIEYLLDQGGKDQETIVLEWFEKGQKLTFPEFLQEYKVLQICEEIDTISQEIKRLEALGILYLQSAYEDKQLEFDSTFNKELEPKENELLKSLNL